MDYEIAEGRVTAVYWRCRGACETTGEWLESWGRVELEGDVIVPWDDITPSMSIDWAREALGAAEVAQVEADTLARLDTKLNPTDGTGTPWSDADPEEEPEPELTTA